MHSIACILVTCLALGACAEPGREPVELLRFDFASAPDTTVLGPSYGGPAALAVFDEGFSPPQGRGIWTLGAAARAQLHVVGADVELRLALSTNPALSERGQSVTVEWNGEALATLDLPHGWTVRRDTLVIAPGRVKQGWNELTLRPARVNEGEIDDARALGVFLREISLRARATDDELAARRALLEADELPDEWSYGPIEVRRAQAAGASARSFAGAANARPAPDVMMIVLDAARADHSSCYGYERDTTPFVDELAADGVRWTEAYANAPFTPISIATLFTGLPWRDHRVLENDTALDERIVTLAQSMRENGYRTVAYSDNPYVGPATRLGRGFDEFTAVRTHPRQVEYKKTIDTSAPDWVPHRPAEMVSWLFDERVDQGVREQAHFLYVHVMPPHTPYVPGPAHDRWKAPDYEGDIDGSADQVNEIVAGRRALSAADRQRLLDLYDGNLHRGDAVARAVFEKWRSLQRGRELLVIVLSDHGEAFGEHGTYGHLTTLYDEMMHVPVVFWPRAAWAQLEEKADDLHGLGELMPLLLSQVGARLPDDSTWPRYWRRAYETPERSRREALLLRSTTIAGLVGVRRAGELLVFGARGERELYGLGTDPGQLRDLRRARPDDYARGLSSLVRVLAAGAAAAAPDTARYDEEEREALKSLGYVH